MAIMLLTRRHFLMTSAVGIAGSMTPANAFEVIGKGASFPEPLYIKWAERYRREQHVNIHYRGIGSYLGIQQLRHHLTTFAASDYPLKRAQLAKYGLTQFPTVIGGVVPVVNIDGILPGGLVLDGPTLIQIFMGRIENWNDPAIMNINPNSTLPSQSITVIYRAHGSGTMSIFADYLSKVSAEWRSKFGAGISVNWPVGTDASASGASTNNSVADMVHRIPGAIGCVQHAYAKQHDLAYVNIINQSGEVVAPNANSFREAAASATWEESERFPISLTNQVGPGCWPITGATFILIDQQPPAPAAAAEALKFFAWAYSQGGRMALDLDYVPISTKLIATIQKIWALEIKDAAGRAIYTIHK